MKIIKKHHFGVQMHLSPPSATLHYFNQYSLMHFLISHHHPVAQWYPRGPHRIKWCSAEQTSGITAVAIDKTIHE